ncbi:MAG TPA: 30S ribosomal protein S4, partial [Actinobacteria bacterium]|nr:30S ribosomal protein S4 [Actinomycetota bacterium]
LRILESRLDNVVYRAGFAQTRPQARQLVNHGHFEVNGKKVDIPSYQVRAGDVVTLRERSRNLIIVDHSLETVRHSLPEWLEIDADERTIVVHDVPNRAQIDTQIREQLVVELYSR